MIHEVNIEKNINVIREMNDAEYAQYLIDVETSKVYAAKLAEEKIKEDAKKAAKIEALATLGLNQEIVSLLAE
jgi:hypothetical protein